MPYEKGGRADKSGNTYERRWVIYQLLKVIEEELVSVEIEPIGADEEGIDLWITFNNGIREGQQCKGKNASKQEWDISSLKSRNIIKNWKKQLDRNSSYLVSLVSPLSSPLLESLIDRAKNTNDNSKDFLEYQISNSSKEFKEFFNGYCSELNMDSSKTDTELCQIIDYLKRTSFNQVPDSFQREIVLNKIQYLFIGDKNDIYDGLENLILEGNILGKAITNSFLRGYLKDRNIMIRNIPLDSKVASRINELNEEYKEVFTPINGNMIVRNEFESCIDCIKDGKSLIIHGKAGIGKSGCTNAIISYCENNNIPFIALKLDKKIPSGSAEKWGKELGLQSSIAYSLHSISQKDNALIILDQLDALSWTKAHSRDALIICSEIIRQVTLLNQERDKKMLIAIICRTFDLENDNNIKLLLKKKEENVYCLEWEKISVNELAEDTVKSVIGDSYNTLSKKLKNVLRIPSNLYIWQHLDREKVYDDFSTTNELISEWWKQLLNKSSEYDVDEKSVQNARDVIVDKLDKFGKLNISIKLLNIIPRILDYLATNGFIKLINHNVSFTHQSIFDYFLVEKMFQRFYEGESIVSIIGDKEKQTPSKRYQIQMLLQNIQENDIDDFINVGKKMLESSEVRFYIKYVFLEVLGQCSSLNISINNFIIEYLKKEEFKSHIIDTVINEHLIFVEFLLKEGILDNWMQDDKRKNIAINLISNLSPQYSHEFINFIKKYTLKNKEDDQLLSRCFKSDINQDTDELFELRIKFYEHYPEMTDIYVNFREMLKKCELRAITIIGLLLSQKNKNNGNNIYRYEEEFIDENSDIMIRNSKDVIEKLLPRVPLEKDYYKIYSSWNKKYSYNNCLERTCVELIKKANTALININPNAFIEMYKDFMGEGYVVFNEIILSGLVQLPVEFSDTVVKYIIFNLNENIFDKTSGNEDELYLAKAVIRKHSKGCSEDMLLLLENSIISYIDPDAKELYKSRIQYNRDNEFGIKVYWSFWGDMQIALLPCLPIDRMSEKTKNLLMTLSRKFENVKNRYVKLNNHSGWVTSPVARKKINNKQWLKILTGNKLKIKSHSNWIEVKGGFIENSIEQFSESFYTAVTDEPDRFINLVLSCEVNINEIFIDKLFSGVATSNEINNISSELIEKMIFKYRYNYDNSRADYICNIIERKETQNWSKNMMYILNDIANNHLNPMDEKANVVLNGENEMKSVEMIRTNAINCVRGNAARAIGNLLWSNKELYVQFKNTITKLCEDINPAVRMANMFALNSIYNIDRVWASEKILDTFEKDYRMAGFYGSKQLFFLMYPKYRERVLSIILKCFYSEDKDLIQVGSYSLCEMYIQNNEFQEKVFDIENMNESQTKYILEMAILYFNKEQYNNLIKELIILYLTSKYDLEFPISRIFYDNLINLERDKDFLVNIMKTNMSRRIIHAFVNYLEENSKSIIEYKDIIIPMSYELINNQPKDSNSYWGVNEELSKLILGLYDETSQSGNQECKEISEECLTIWDLMFEKKIGLTRILSQQMIDR